MKIDLFIGLLFLFYSCKKDVLLPATPSGNSIDFQVTHVVEAELVVFDTIRYTNDAGNKYSVTRLEYYISTVVLKKSDGSLVETSTANYINGRDSDALNFSLSAIPSGDYVGLSLFVGLDSVTNQTNALPNNSENINMAWPVMMGGGYHFMKFEGHYEESIDVLGYAVHLGTNTALVKVEVNTPFSVNKAGEKMTLEMNLNEWFRNPAIYNLYVDGSYTMGKDSLMEKIAANGVNVFTLRNGW